MKAFAVSIVLEPEVRRQKSEVMKMIERARKLSHLSNSSDFGLRTSDGKVTFSPTYFMVSLVFIYFIGIKALIISKKKIIM